MDDVRLAAIDRLGLEIEERWQAADYADEALPEIAAGALAEGRPCERLTPLDVIEWTLACPRLPAQHDLKGAFGQPPVTLYRGRKFFIEALFWVDGTTSIHEHSFSGAFQVLEGSSLHTEWTFDAARPVGPHLALGRLAARTSGLLRRGDTRRILRGGRFIHSLFHLERPSVTLVVRTERAAAAGLPQLSYLYPGVAFDPFVEEDWSTRALQVARLLEEIEHPRSEAIVGDLLARADAHTCFLLLHAASRRPDRLLYERLLERARPRRSDLVAALAQAFEEERRVRAIVRKRHWVANVEHRYFLALLMNAPARADVLRLAAAYAPGADPADTVVRWIRELGSVTVKLQAGTEAWEPNVLGLPDLTEAALAALRARLRGETGGAAEAAAGDAQAADALRSLERSLFLRPLFRAPAEAPVAAAAS